MTYTEQAVRLAVEGGWIAKMCVDVEKKYRWYIHQILLDPTFWTSLGKGMGWGGENNLAPEMRLWTWKDYWHSLIDHLAQGKDIESFFAALLKDKPTS